VLLLLNACSISPLNLPPPAYKLIHPSQQFILTQPIIIPADKAAVFFQNGRIIDPKLVNYRVPNCRLVVNGLSEQERIIQPDTFILRKLHYDRSFVLNENAMIASHSFSRHKGFQLVTTQLNSDQPVADHTMFTQFGMFDGGAPIAEEYSISFYFQPKPDSIVSHLICGHWEDPHDGNHLSLQQIQMALGSIIEIKS